MVYSCLLLSLLSLSLVHSAPQGSPACGEVPQNPVAGQIGAQYLQIPGCGDNSSPSPNTGGATGGGTGTNDGSDNTSGSPSLPSTTSSSPPSGNTGSSPPSSETTSGSRSTSNNTNAGPPPPPAQSGGGKCPEYFRNTVFNTGAARNAGWPQKTWNSLTSNGLVDWVGFALDTLNVTTTYNTDSGAAATIPSLNAAQINQIMDPTEVSAAIDLIKTRKIPYLTLFNEPDYSYKGYTPLTSPTDAAAALKPLFAAPNPHNTVFLSPALANANSDWLPTFRDACNGCMDHIPIITMHLYNPDPTAALNLVTQLHSTWPDKRIWITELAPGTGDCTLDVGEIVDWMNTLIPQIVALGYVDRIFWNCGEASVGTTCKTDLTNGDGSATEVLKAYAAVC